jgi:hypothetical protein
VRGDAEMRAKLMARNPEAYAAAAKRRAKLKTLSEK